jgi:hypothetical protein
MYFIVSKAAQKSLGTGPSTEPKRSTIYEVEIISKVKDVGHFKKYTYNLRIKRCLYHPYNTPKKPGRAMNNYVGDIFNEHQIIDYILRRKSFKP